MTNLLHEHGFLNRTVLNGIPRFSDVLLLPLLQLLVQELVPVLELLVLELELLAVLLERLDLLLGEEQLRAELRALLLNQTLDVLLKVAVRVLALDHAVQPDDLGAQLVVVLLQLLVLRAQHLFLRFYQLQLVLVLLHAALQALDLLLKLALEALVVFIIST